MSQFVVLLPGVGSPVVLPVTTELVMIPVTGAFTVRLRFVTAPLVKLATDQNTFVRLALVAPPPVALMNVRFTGRLSVTTTLTAVDGPPLVTRIE